MKIVRAARTGHFTIVPNSSARDRELSFRARGVLLYLLSHTDGWAVSAEQLAREATEGREAIQTAMKELINAGYLVQRRTQNGSGQWTWNRTLFDTAPEHRPTVEMDPAEAPSPRNPSTVSPVTARPVSEQPFLVEPVPDGSLPVGPLAEVPSSDDPNLAVPQAERPQTGQPRPVEPVPERQGADSLTRVPRPRATRVVKEHRSSNTSQNTPSAPPSSAPSGPVGRSTPPGGGGNDSTNHDNAGHVSAGHRLADDLPAPVRPRSGRQRDSTAELFNTYLARGYAADQLVEIATREPVPVNVLNPPKFIEQRLGGLLAPTASRAKIEWCGQCEPSNRWVEDDQGNLLERCPRCHPARARTA